MLKERYENPEKLLANCTSILYLGSTELELLKELETKLGKTSLTFDGSEKPLCSQAELMALEKAWDHKEAIYMNLSEGIRYCTMLPSIEAYEIGNHPRPSYSTNTPEIETYTVEEFTRDIARKKIRPPFVCANKEEKPESSDSGEEKAEKSNSMEEELEKLFDEMFATSEDE
jgi:hypothetical protein